MRQNFLFVLASTALGVLLVRFVPAALAADFGQAGKPSAQAAGQSPDSSEERRMVVLRLEKSNEGEVWELTFLDLPDKADQVRARVGDTTMIEKIKAWKGVRLTVETSPDVSDRAVEETLHAMVKAGIQNIFIVGPYVLHRDRIYYMPSQDTGVSEPEVVVDKEQLKQLAAAPDLREQIYRWPDGRRSLMLQLLIDATGKVVEIRAGGVFSLSSDVRAKVTGTIKVATPAHRGTEPVPGVAMVRIDVP